MSTTRRDVLKTLLGVVVAAPTALLLSGCPNKPEGGGNAADPANGKTGAQPSATRSRAAGKQLKVGLVTDTGGIDDKSFNAAANAGLQRAKTELGADVKVTESKQAADYVSNLSRFAQNRYDLVFAVGFLMQDALKEVAARFPDVKWAIIDGDAPERPNAVALKFKEEEGSFLTGALAGAMTKTGKVGFVGGLELPLIKKFEAGYKAGVKTTRPDAKVVVGYAGSFTDSPKGRELAISQMSAGADIVFHAAGKVGEGVISAVRDKGKGFYAIGVDQDQDYLAEGRVLTSMVKRVDNAVFDTCQALSQDKFEPGTRIFGLKEGGVGLSEMKFTKQDVPAETMTRINALRDQIIAGTLKPPTTLAELETFQPPK